jgi:hypothetical protein
MKFSKYSCDTLAFVSFLCALAYFQQDIVSVLKIQMKILCLYDVTPYSSANLYRRLGETYFIYLLPKKLRNHILEDFFIFIPMKIQI